MEMKDDDPENNAMTPARCSNHDEDDTASCLRLLDQYAHPPNRSAPIKRARSSTRLTPPSNFSGNDPRENERRAEPGGTKKHPRDPRRERSVVAATSPRPARAIVRSRPKGIVRDRGRSPPPANARPTDAIRTQPTISVATALRAEMNPPSAVSRIAHLGLGARGGGGRGGGGLLPWNGCIHVDGGLPG